VPEVKRQQQRSITTRRHLVRAARQLFAKKGYGSTSIEDILGRSKVSRGALYHHYESKTDIFEVVFEQVASEVAESVRTATGAERHSERRLAAAVDGFLDACLDRDVQQIVLLDAPAVIPFDRWTAIQARHIQASFEEVLREAIAAKALEAQPVEPLATVLLGTLNAAALRLARADDLRAERRRVGKTIRRLLDGLRP
jgi:AcrR family transcriptional regulator